MFCSKCGAKMSNEEKVCPVCGEPAMEILEKPKLSQKTWFTVVLLFCCWPVGVFLMWKYEKFGSVKIRKGITIALIALSVFYLFTGKVDPKEDAISRVQDSKFMFADDVIKSSFHYGDLFSEKYFDDVNWTGETTQEEGFYIVTFKGTIKDNGSTVVVKFGVSEKDLCPFYLLAGTGTYGGSISENSYYEAGRAVCGLVTVLAPNKMKD